MRFLSEFLDEQSKSEDQDGGENGGKEQSRFQIPSDGLCDPADHTGADRRTEIARKCEKRKHRRSALRTFSGGKADRSRPHNADRKSAERTADQPEYRDR